MRFFVVGCETCIGPLQLSREVPSCRRRYSAGEFLLEGTVKGGVIPESHHGTDLLCGDGGQKQAFGGDQAALGDIVIETHIHPLAKQLVDGAFADQKAAGCLRQGDLLGHL